MKLSSTIRCLLSIVCVLYTANLSGQDSISYRKYNINGVGTLTIPNSMELQSPEMQRISDSLEKHTSAVLGIPLLIEKAIFQQAGLNSYVKSSFETYARVIVGIIPGSKGDYGTREDVKNATEVELREAGMAMKASIEKGFIIGSTNMKMIAWYGIQRVELKSGTALRYSYLRTVNDNPPVLVNVYRLHYDDRIFSLTLSYRLQDELRWKSTMEGILNSFIITYKP